MDAELATSNVRHFPMFFPMFELRAPYVPR